MIIFSSCSEKKKSGSLKRGSDVTSQKPPMLPKASFLSPAENSIQKASFYLSGACQYPGDITLSGDIAGPLEISCGANHTFVSEILLMGADGSKTIMVIQQFGEKQASATLTLIKDTTEPVCSITGLANDYNVSTVSFSASCLDANLDRVECRLDSGVFSTCASGIQNFVALNEGPHVFEMRGIDKAQNQSVVASASFSIDTLGPSGITGLGIRAGADLLSDSWLRGEGDPTLDFIAPSDATTLTLDLTTFDQQIVLCSSGLLALPLNQYTFVGCTLPSGVAYKIQMRATDTLGNQGAVEIFSFNKPRNVALTFNEGSNYDFGNLNTGAVAEKTLTIQVAHGPATNITSILSGSGYSFKGGHFPGVGGTCGSTMNSNCTVILNFQKNQAGSFSGSLQINYSNGFETLNQSIQLSAVTTLPAPTEIKAVGLNAVVVNDCLAISFQSVTSTGVISPVLANTNVTLAVNNGTGSWYSDALCSSVMTSATIVSGQSQVSLFFKSATSGQNLTLVGSTATLGSATHYLNVGLAPSNLLISGNNQVVVNSCSRFEVHRIDSLGNKVGTPQVQNINLNMTGSVAAYSDANCSLPISTLIIDASTSTAVFYVKVSAIEMLSIGVSDPGSILSSDTHNLSGVSALSWWNTSWTRRVRVNLNNLDQSIAHTQMQVLLKIDHSKIDYSKVQPQGQDLRILASDDSTLLPFEIEKWDPSGESLVWVQVANISAASDSDFVSIYFGNPNVSDTQNITGTWSTHSSVWHLQENPSAVAPQFKDSTVSGWHGTAENSPTSTVGVIGNGLNINGNFDGFDVGQNLSTIIGYSSTLSFWIKTNQLGNNTNWLAPGLTGVEQAGGTNDIFFGWLDASGKLGITAGDGAGSKSNFIVNDNAWRHVTISRSHTTGATKFYINGVLNGSGNPGSGAKTTAFTKFGQIADTGGTPVELDGLIDEIRLSTGVLSDDRIKAEFKYLNNTHVIWSSVEVLE